MESGNRDSSFPEGIVLKKINGTLQWCSGVQNAQNCQNEDASIQRALTSVDIKEREPSNEAENDTFKQLIKEIQAR